jgi:hypothetical protein
LPPSVWVSSPATSSVTKSTRSATIVAIASPAATGGDSSRALSSIQPVVIAAPIAGVFVVLFALAVCCYTKPTRRNAGKIQTSSDGSTQRVSNKDSIVTFPLPSYAEATTKGQVSAKEVEIEKGKPSENEIELEKGKSFDKEIEIEKGKPLDIEIETEEEWWRSIRKVIDETMR